MLYINVKHKDKEFIMQSSSIRYVQHHFSDVLKLAETEEEVQVLRRNKPVAMIVPLEKNNEIALSWDSHSSEIETIFNGKKVPGKLMSDIVVDARGDF
jgi:antitoxin (DNA-binding transcriptional repressor) of toxin-antitoxin stability system